MDNIDFDKINNYFNKLALHIFESKDIENKYERFLELNDFFISFFQPIYFKYEGEFNVNNKEINLSIEDVINITKEILGTISEEYVLLIDELITSGKLDFSYNNEYSDSHFKLECKNSIITKEININRVFNYTDVRTLIHEFMHYISSVKNGFKNKLLTEFISIYFELYTNKYIYDKYNTDISELNYADRIVNVYKRCRHIQYMQIPFATYKRYGNLDKDSYKLANEIMSPYEDYDYFNECNRIISFINKYEIDKKEDEELLMEEFHYYFYATMLALYGQVKFDMKKMVNLANNISNEENEDLDLIELLNKYNLHIEDDFDLLPVEEIEKYIEFFNNKKQGKTI